MVSNLYLRIAQTIYIANIVVMAIIGLIFVCGNELLPFHTDVIQTAWADVDANAQILYLGMMRTEGAGFLAAATALCFLWFYAFRTRQKWSYTAMTIIGVVEYAPTFVANYQVAANTGATPPWLLMLTLILSLLIAWLCAHAGHQRTASTP